MSNLKVSTLSGLTGASVPIADVVNGTARAWVNFNGQGTVAIRSSYNVSSVTDLGVGLYQANLTTSTPDNNCAIAVSYNIPSWQSWTSNIIYSENSKIKVELGYGSGPTFADFGTVNLILFR